MRFVKRHFEKNNNTATLLVPAGRTWPVKCSVAKTDVKFSRGWRNFVVDNRLEVGDVCASEMIKCTGTLLRLRVPAAVGVAYDLLELLACFLGVVR